MTLTPDLLHKLLAAGIALLAVIAFMLMIHWIEHYGEHDDDET